MFLTVVWWTDNPLYVPKLWFVMMPLRASMSAPPTATPLNDGLSPLTVRCSIVTLSACTRKTLLAPTHKEPPPPPPQLGFETAGSTIVEASLPMMSTLFVTVTFSVKVPAVSDTVPPAETLLTPAWIVFSGLLGQPVLASLPLTGSTVHVVVHSTRSKSYTLVFPETPTVKLSTFPLNVPPEPTLGPRPNTTLALGYEAWT